MKTLIFSDTHLTPHFSDRTYSYLVKIISKTDRVIINGDFWDHHFYSWKKFTGSKWKKLFPLLKSKKAVYIYGNHDQVKVVGRGAEAFSVLQTKSYEFESGGKRIHVEHGDRIIPTPEMKLYFVPVPKLISYGHLLLDYLEVKLTGGRNFVSWNANRILKKRARKEFPGDTILILSHTHRAEQDRENNYYNTGFIRFGQASYITVKDEEITLVREKY